MAPVIRPATAADQPTIKSIVRAAQLFRLGSLFAPLDSPILGRRVRIIAMRRQP